MLVFGVNTINLVLYATTRLSSFLLAQASTTRQWRHEIKTWICRIPRGAWIRQFAATARTKKAKDDNEGVNEISDLFLSKAGLESIRTLSLMTAPTDLEDLTFLDIKELILKTIRLKKKLVITERTRFLSLKQ